MSIQSTTTVSRSFAIHRIQKIYGYIKNHYYSYLEESSFEPNYDITEFLNDFEEIKNIEYINQWTNKMLEDVLDKPYFRKSIFDNYAVIGD